jgi:hypothetical protein
MLLAETVDVEVVAAKFLAVVSPNRIETTRRALAIILSAYTAGSIYNTEYQDAKDILSRSVDDAYEELVQKPFLWGKGYTPESEIDGKIGIISGLHNCISGAKRVAKLKPRGPFGDALRAFFDATEPLAQIVASLKTKIIKGKKPNPAAAAKKAAQFANKTVRTCACCFRGIALLGNGLIADHGYQLPEPWQKTPSCPGRDFRPLEVSSDGLVFMVKNLKAQVEHLLKRQASTGQLTQLKKKNWKGEILTITPESPDWGKTLKDYVRDLKGDLDRTQDALKDFESKLAAWKPIVIEQRGLRALVSELREHLASS